MPWKECSVMDERMQFVARRLAGESMAELCREFGIARKTGYKIFDRYQHCGIDGLTDRNPPLAPPRSWSYPTARFDSARLLPRVPTLSSVVRADAASAPATHVRASPAIRVFDSLEDFPFVAATKPPGDIRTRVSLRRPPRSVRRTAGPRGCLVAASGNTNSTG
jgi:hypothetical protein